MFKRILLPIAVLDQRTDERTLELALDLVRREPDAELFLLHVMPGYVMPVVASFFPPEARGAATDETQNKLTAYIRENVPKGIKVTEIIREGRPYEQIIHEAKHHDTDLIVIRSKRMGSLEGFVLGSTAERVVRHAPCTVMVVR